MTYSKSTFFLLAVALTLSGCGLFGGSDSTDLSVAEDVSAQPTVNSVQPVPAEQPDTVAAPAEEEPATAALPTAVTLPTAAPTPEPTVDRSQPTTYVVQSGDVLGLIAERFDVDIAELRRVNDLDGNLIRVGQELTIPAAAGSEPASDSAETASDSDADPAPAAPAPTTAPAAPVTCTAGATGHCIQPGESLLGIALKYDVTVEALRDANPGITGDLIQSGQVLNIPGSSDPAPDPSPADPAPADPAPAVVDPGATATPDVTAGPTSNADCAARNPEFPYFHASDGLCYANPIGGTPVPTAPGAADPDTAGETTCDPGFFLWEDGLCYRIPGATVEATVTPTVAAGSGSGSGSGGGDGGTIVEDYGRPPCRDGYVVLVATNKCWPEASNLNPTTVTPTPTS